MGPKAHKSKRFRTDTSRLQCLSRGHFRARIRPSMGDGGADVAVKPALSDLGGTGLGLGDGSSEEGVPDERGCRSAKSTPGARLSSLRLVNYFCIAMCNSMSDGRLIKKF